MEQKLETKQEEYVETELGEFPASWKIMQLKEFLEPQVRATIKPTTNYKSIGIRSHGKGTFLKPDCDPKKIALETLWEVKYRDLITNITFAWEGAIALVKKEDDGALVSHRFPTYIFNEKIVLSEFFQYVILQRWFVNELSLISPGSAGRNRVLRKTDFIKIKVPIPTIEEQQKIAYVLSIVQNAQEKTENFINSLKEFKKSAMKHLFTYGTVPFDEIDKVELKETEIGMMPKSWEIKKLGDIFDIYAGGDLKKMNFSKVKSEKFRYPIFSNTIENKGLYGYSDGYKYPENSITVTARGTIGFTMPRFEKFNAIIRLLVLIPKNSLNITFVSEYINNKINFHSDGSNIPQLPVPKMSYTLIPLPPLQIQQKIASILSIIDEKIQAEEQKKKALKETFNSLLKNLMTAKIRVNNLEVGA